MTNNQPQFDIYPELDRQIGVASGVDNQPDDLAEAVKAEVGAVAKTDGPPVRTPDFKNSEERAEAIQSWAGPQIEEATERWRDYRDELDIVPLTPDQLTLFMKDFAWKIDLLYRAAGDIAADGDVNPKGVPIYDTLKLVIIPWKEFQYRLNGDLEGWVNRMLAVSSETPIEIPPTLKAALSNDLTNQGLYVNPDAPNSLMSADDYLRKKIKDDGDWGIMLMQAKGPAGSANAPVASPDEMTGNGKLKVGQSNTEANYSISDMGIFEWLALVMQEGAPQSGDNSWLLANALIDHANQQTSVPLASAKGLGLAKSSTYGDNIRLRYCIGGPVSPDLSNRHPI